MEEWIAYLCKTGIIALCMLFSFIFTLYNGHKVRKRDSTEVDFLQYVLSLLAFIGFFIATLYCSFETLDALSEYNEDQKIEVTTEK